LGPRGLGASAFGVEFVQGSGGCLGVDGCVDRTCGREWRLETQTGYAEKWACASKIGLPRCQDVVLIEIAFAGFVPASRRMTIKEHTKVVAWLQERVDRADG
jgi:hypothetical protein